MIISGVTLSGVGYVVDVTVVKSNLVLWLDAANPLSYSGSGSTWNDLSGNGTNYTLYNTPTYSTNNSGVLTFAGASSQYATSTNTVFNSSAFNTYTFNLWVYPTAAGQLLQVDGQATTNTAYHYSAIEINSGGTISFGQWQGPLATVTTSAQSFNKWYNLTLTYNGTTAIAYINGSAIGSSNLAWTSPGAQTFLALMAADSTDMGTNANGSGSIGVFMCYNTALSAAQVYQNFSALRVRYGV